jgi:hypothetical protein
MGDESLEENDLFDGHNLTGRIFDGLHSSRAAPELVGADPGFQACRQGFVRLLGRIKKARSGRT